METIKEQLNQLRQKNIEKIKHLLLSRVKSNGDEVLQIIRELTHNLAHVSFVDSETVRVVFFRESKLFSLNSNEEVDFGTKKDHNIDSLCEYLVDKTIYYYSKRLERKTKKPGVAKC